jgi:hypothetical protein
MKLLDPWDDARQIAQRLKSPNSVLHLFVGMESSCIKCAILRQVWNEYVRSLPADDTQVWLWFDIDEHMDFLADYLPDDPPVYIRYDNKVRVSVATLKGIASNQLEVEIRSGMQEIPDFYAALTDENWSA